MMTRSCAIPLRFIGAARGSLDVCPERPRCLVLPGQLDKPLHKTNTGSSDTPRELSVRDICGSHPSQCDTRLFLFHCSCCSWSPRLLSPYAPLWVAAYFLFALAWLSQTICIIGLPSYMPYDSAPIKLQAHSDPTEPISFRNIWIRELP